MLSLSEKQYPLGRFAWGQSYSEKQIKGFIKDIEKFPKSLRKAIKKLSGEELDMSYRPDGWTARQVVHHLADSHMNAYIRCKLAATENKPVIKPYEENLWAETHDGRSLSVKVSLELLDALHARWAAFLRSLEPKDFRRAIVHPATGRTISLGELMALYSWHGRHHIAHIKLVGGWTPPPRESDNEPAAPSAPAPTARRGRKPGPKAQATADKPKLSRSEAMARSWAERKAKAAAEAPPAPEKPAKRKRRSSEEVAAEKAAKAAQPKLSRAEALAKARAARKSNSEKPAAVSGEKRRPGRPASNAPKPQQPKRSPEEIRQARIEALAKARAAKGPAKPKAEKKAPPSGEKRRPGRPASGVPKPQQPKRSPDEIRQGRLEALAKARAARGPAKPKAEKNQRSAEEIKQARIEALAKARAARGPAKPKTEKVQRSPEELKAMRQANIQKALAARAALRTDAPKPKAEPKPKLSPEELKAARAAALEKARAARKKK